MKNKQNNQFLIGIISITAIVLALLFFSTNAAQNTITGDASIGIPSIPIVSCWDGDGGYEPAFWANCGDNFGEYSDYCISSEYMMEYRCSSSIGFCYGTPVICTDAGYDFCTGGECLNMVECADAINTPIDRGVCADEQDTYYDYCDSSRLVEYECTTLQPGVTSAVCIPTTKDCINLGYDDCLDGVCINFNATANCTDTDNGLTYNIFGTVRYYNVLGTLTTISDTCSGSVLSEARCVGTIGSTSNYTCPNGCSGGACLAATANCTDTDNGLTYNIFGTVRYYDASGTLTTISDTCSGSVLSEAKCVGIIGSTSSYTCPNGCSGGACLAATTCADTDGTSITTSGKCTDSSGIDTDYCVDSTHVREFYCSGSSCDSFTFLCQNSCSGGACVGQTVSPKSVDQPTTQLTDPLASLMNFFRTLFGFR